MRGRRQDEENITDTVLLFVIFPSFCVAEMGWMPGMQRSSDWRWVCARAHACACARAQTRTHACTHACSHELVFIFRGEAGSCGFNVTHRPFHCACSCRFGAALFGRAFNVNILRVLKITFKPVLVLLDSKWFTLFHQGFIRSAP